MRILVCGSREWPGTWEDIELPDDDNVTVIHGAYSRIIGGVQVSVDMLADFVARGLGHAVDPYPVDHAIDGPWPGAGPRRNARMLRDGKPDRGLAFGPLWKRKPIQVPNCTCGRPLWSSRLHDRKCPLRNSTMSLAIALFDSTYIHTGTGDMVSKMLAAGIPVRWVASPGACALDLTTMPEPPR